jgi:hypothetical protein
MRISTMTRCGGRQKQLRDALQRRLMEIAKPLERDLLVEVRL